jgi:DNA-binding transcriptional LysR family regulator
MDRLTSIEIFARVVETGSFVAAAERLGISRAAASKHVLRLEERLGARLLNRTTRRVGLTEEGAAFYDRCARILAELEEAEHDLGAARREPRGTLRVNAPVSFGVLHLGAAIGSFAGRYPQVRIALALNDRVVDLVEEGFDVAVRIGRLPSSSLVARRICETGLVPVASPDYWGRHGKPATPEELRRHNCLVYTLQAGSDWRFVGPHGSEHLVTVTGSISASNGDVLRAAALAGIGVALLPDFIAGPDVQSGALVAAFADYRAPVLGVHAVYPPTRHVPAKLRAFIDFLGERFSPRPSWALPAA